jgi:hypothetical protein
MSNLWLGVRFGVSAPNGSCVLLEVDPDGPVGRAGGQAGDLVHQIDGASAMAMRGAWHDGSRERLPGRPMSWLIERAGERQIISPEWREVDGAGGDGGAGARGRGLRLSSAAIPSPVDSLDRTTLWWRGRLCRRSLSISLMTFRSARRRCRSGRGSISHCGGLRRSARARGASALVSRRR